MQGPTGSGGGSQRLWVGLTIAVLVPLLATGVQVAGLLPAPLWLVVALVAVAGLVVAGSGVWTLVAGHRAAAAETRAAEEERDRTLASLLRTGVPVPQVAQVDPYETLGVFASSYAPKGTDPYVERDDDGKLRAVLQDAETSLVVLRGTATVGKKHSAYKALTACMADRPIIVPARPSERQPTPLNTLLNLGPPVEGDLPPVLWLDNADQWSDRGDLDLLSLRAWRERYPGMLIVATLRYGAIPDDAHPQAAGTIDQARQTRQVWADLRAQTWVKEHDVKGTLSDDELQRAKSKHPQHAEGFEKTRSIGRFFAGTDQLIERLQEGKGRSPLGVVLVEAVVAWRRCGLPAPAPRDIVYDLVEQRVANLHGIDDQRLDQAVTWAADPIPSGAALITTMRSGQPDGFRVDDSIYDHLNEGRGHPATELAIASKVGTALARNRDRDDHDVLTTRHNIAFWTGEAGDATGALQQLRDLLLDQQRVLGPDHPDTLTTRHNVAWWTGRAGDPAGALQQLRDLRPDLQRVLGPDHPDTLATRGNIAAWTGETGDATGALQQLRDLLPDLQRVLGPDHPNTLNTRTNIAAWTGETGDATGALQQLRDLLPDLQRVLGPDHPDTLATRGNIAAWTGQAGDAADALQQFHDLLPDWQRVLGADHPNTLNTRGNIAAWTGQAGDATGALEQLRDLLPDWQRVLGADHPNTLNTRHNIAAWTGETGDATGALQQLRDLLPDLQRVLGPDHPDTLTTRNNIAFLAEKLEKRDMNS